MKGIQHVVAMSMGRYEAFVSIIDADGKASLADASSRMAREAAGDAFDDMLAFSRALQRVLDANQGVLASRGNVARPA